VKDVENCIWLGNRILEMGLFSDPKRPTFGGFPWRISPEPFHLDREVIEKIEELGHHLLKFYKALNSIYFSSVRGTAPHWISWYLDLGKPEVVVEYGRMRRFRSQMPPVIRPDLFITEEGMAITELDSVPGGIGLLAGISMLYSHLGYEIVGGGDGMTRGFMEAMKALVPDVEDPLVAIVVSEESASFRPEMRRLSEMMVDLGMRAFVIEPKDLMFSEEGLFLRTDGEASRIDVLYRFFELFDLKNIPKWELIFYAAKKEKVVMTPPPKAFLEEKLAMALFHHPSLVELWVERMGRESVELLRRLFPMTWIMDPRDIPPHAVIPGLSAGGKAIQNFMDLSGASQRERRLVIKPSGFSELAWGSRGVRIGHDMSAERWRESIEMALRSFPNPIYILQEFKPSKLFDSRYYDPISGDIKEMKGRVRLSPYYFVIGEEARLGGILATICPPDKKLVHGMVDAIMVPVLARGSP
jgi:hypothetical protein